MEKTVYDRRILAHIVFEAATPLSIGSGNENPMTDSVLLTDASGLPYIPGTTIAGLLRHSLADSSFFGEQGEEGFGSEIIFTEAKILDLDSTVCEAYTRNTVSSDLKSQLDNLPVRNHVRIGHTGTGVDKGKYDEQILFKGARFCFDMDMIVSSDEDAENFEKVLDALRSPYFRVGGGSRSGFGKIKIVKMLTKVLDLKIAEDLREYLDISPRLDKDYAGWKEESPSESADGGSWVKYELKLVPDDFFQFGSGKASNEADMTPVTENYISWAGNIGTFKEAKVFIPATSVKGALAHRTAYYFNKKSKVYSDKIYIEDFNRHTGSGNPAVRAIFGAEKILADKELSENQKAALQPSRGKAIFSDVYSDNGVRKLLNHVKIDRFTGGTIDGALFTEEVTDTAETFRMEIFLSKDIDGQYVECFESALKDIAGGFLPLGGGAGRGHGFFTGKIYKDGAELK